MGGLALKRYRRFKIFPYEEGTERFVPRRAGGGWGGWFKIFPYEEGTESNNAAGVSGRVQGSKYFPTKRELKAFIPPHGKSTTYGFKIFPYEEGTERVENVFRHRGPSSWFKIFPYEEGTESANADAGE